jgi:hypothetical protein
MMKLKRHEHTGSLKKGPVGVFSGRISWSDVPHFKQPLADRGFPYAVKGSSFAFGE